MKKTLLVSLLLLVNSCAVKPQHFFSFTSQKMGVDFRIDLYSESKEKAEKAVASAFERIDEINQIMSDYIVDSEIWKLSESSGKSQKLKVSPEMWEVLVSAKEINEISDGAFDITAGPYIMLWRKARVIKRLPSERSMTRAANKVGMQKVKFYSAEKSVELTAEKMRLDLGGIAKGYAADEALKILKEHGIKYAMVDGSGDISLTEHPEGLWKVFISDSEKSGRQYIELKSGAIATSGDTYQHVEIDGKRYSHIVDPKTGLGVTGSYRVTVIADKGQDADALASALTVMGPEKGLRLVEEINGVEALIEKIDNGKLKSFKSSAFPKVHFK